MRFLTFLFSVPFLWGNNNSEDYSSSNKNNNINWPPDVDVVTKPVPPKGDGVFTKNDISRGTFICRYHGKVLTVQEEEELYPGVYPEYCLRISPELSIDGISSGHFSRLINHDEHGNCNLVTNGEKRVAYFTAARDIVAGEELSFDYGVAYFIFRGVTPAPETESRPLDKLLSTITEDEALLLEPPPPPPPTTRSEIQALLQGSSSSSSSDNNNDDRDDNIKTTLMRGLDFYGGVQWETDDLVQIPINLDGKRKTVSYSGLSLQDLGEILGKLCDERVQKER